MMKEKAEVLKKDTNALREKLAIQGYQDGNHRPHTSNLTEKSSYNPIGDGLQQARYNHEAELEAAARNQRPLGVTLILG